VTDLSLPYVKVSYGALKSCCSMANRVVLETRWGGQNIVKMGGNDLLDCFVRRTAEDARIVLGMSVFLLHTVYFNIRKDFEGCDAGTQ
jgi:hypothetical protein